MTTSINLERINNIIVYYTPSPLFFRDISNKDINEMTKIVQNSDIFETIDYADLDDCQILKTNVLILSLESLIFCDPLKKRLVSHLSDAFSGKITSHLLKSFDNENANR